MMTDHEIRVETVRAALRAKYATIDDTIGTELSRVIFHEAERRQMRLPKTTPESLGQNLRKFFNGQQGAHEWVLDLYSIVLESDGGPSQLYLTDDAIASSLSAILDRLDAIESLIRTLSSRTEV